MIARFDKLEFANDPPATKAGPATNAPPVEKDGEYWLRLADEHRRAGGHESALRFFSRSLEVDRTNVTGWLGQVQMLVQLGEYRQAELWGKKALEIFPQHGEVLAAVAQANGRMGAVPEALALSDASLARPGESSYRWLVRGEVLLGKRGGGDDHCFDKANVLDPDWLVPLEAATACLCHAAPAKALRRAQQAVERDASVPRSWLVQGDCQRLLGMDAAAQKSFTRCVELSPKHIEARARLASRAGGLSAFVRRLRGFFGRG